MEYWSHQKTNPLFPDVIWSRPENKSGAGKLLIIGGSSGAMAHVASSYAAAEAAGAGTIHLLVPDSLAKVTKGIPHIAYAPSNPSGGFARQALTEIIHTSSQVDGVLLAGDLGKNSETSLMLEAYIEKYSGLLALANESIESFSIGYKPLLKRSNTLLFLTLHQLQNLGIELKLDKAVTSDIGRQKLAEILHEITAEYHSVLIVEALGSIWTAQAGRVVDAEIVNFSTAKATVWALQQPEKLFEAIVSSLVTN